MTNAQVEVLKAIALDRVLNRFGQPLTNILKYYLEHDHYIMVDASCNVSCSFERLLSALSSIAGEHAAMLILEDVYVELDRLSDGGSI